MLAVLRNNTASRYTIKQRKSYNPPMAIAFFHTWTTYGTWLPGDDRGWFHAGRTHSPDALKQIASRLTMKYNAVILSPPQRQLIEKTIIDHCRIRGWTLHAVNCRTNHAHAAITALNYEPDIPREQFKAWGTRKLNEQFQPRKDWWTQRGWDEFIDDEKSLHTVVTYITDGQDLNKR